MGICVFVCLGILICWYLRDSVFGCLGMFVILYLGVCVFVYFGSSLFCFCLYFDILAFR